MKIDWTEWTNSDSLTTSQTTKAILVIDMPENCIGCPLHQRYYGAAVCRALKKEHTDNRFYQREDWCPLRPLPKYLGFKETETETTDWHFGDNLDRADGWNACLDELLGETK